MDLQRILEVRVGHSVIAESALEAIAKKVAMSSGDARKALDAAARAVSECLKKTPEDVTTDQPLVKAVDTMKVFKSFEKNYKEVIEGQPTAGKVVMCIASVYAEKNQSVTLERLQELVTQTLVETGRLEEMLLSQDFKLIVENLADSGLLKTSLMNKQKKGRKKKADIDESTNSLIELQMPVGDVGALLAEEMKIPFYKTLRERAASKVN